MGPACTTDEQLSAFACLTQGTLLFLKMVASDIPWDDLPGSKIIVTITPSGAKLDYNAMIWARAGVGRAPGSDDDAFPAPKLPSTNEKRDIFADIQEIGRRGLFGAIVGGVTGFGAGSIDVLRDPKMMAAKKSAAAAKVMRYGYLFGGFFAGYQAVYQTTSLYSPLSKEANIGISSTISLFPLAAIPKLRPMVPYGFVLIAFEIFNQWQNEK
jgi:hypothetical protein